MNVKINRRTKLGFGYTSACEQVWNKSQTQSYLQVCDVEEPSRFGTVKQIAEANENDRTLQSFGNGTYYKSKWFVKVDGKWRKIKHNQIMYPTILLETDGFGGRGEKYYYNEIAIEIE